MKPIFQNGGQLHTKIGAQAPFKHSERTQNEFERKAGQPRIGEERLQIESFHKLQQKEFERKADQLPHRELERKADQFRTGEEGFQIGSLHTGNLKGKLTSSDLV